jgi:hypothetical protein
LLESFFLEVVGAEFVDAVNKFRFVLFFIASVGDFFVSFFFDSEVVIIDAVLLRLS